MCYPINSDFVQRESFLKVGTGCLSDDDVDGSLAIDAVLVKVGSGEGDLWEDVHVSTLRKNKLKNLPLIVTFTSVSSGESLLNVSTLLGESSATVDDTFSFGSGLVLSDLKRAF